MCQCLLANVATAGGRYRQHIQFPFYNDFKLYKLNYGECVSCLKHITLIGCLREAAKHSEELNVFVVFVVGTAVVLFSYVAVVVDFRLSFLFYIT